VSSAILYLAIIAIWACVLIPRWLRRGSSHVSGLEFAGDLGHDDEVPEDGPATVPGGAAWSVSGADRAGSRVADDGSHEAASTSADADADAGAGSLEQDSPPPPLTPGESRQRMMAARRRLLGMLIALEAAGIMLAVLGMAALWVVIPPSVMLTGYLLLLREAAHADAERARREQELAGERARARAERRRGAANTATGVAPAASAVPAAPAAEYEDAGPGRDFAPGLAGKYTTSNAEVIDIAERADEDAHEEYTQHKLRAVGD
jgi:hypothetical protein